MFLSLCSWRGWTSTRGTRLRRLWPNVQRSRRFWCRNSNRSSSLCRLGRSSWSDLDIIDQDIGKVDRGWEMWRTDHVITDQKFNMVGARREL